MNSTDKVEYGLGSALVAVAIIYSIYLSVAVILISLIFGGLWLLGIS